MTLYELRKLFHGAGEFFGTTLAPGVAEHYLAVLPWLEGRTRRVLIMTPVVLIFAGAVGLGAIAARKDAHDPVYARQRARKPRTSEANSAIKLALGGVHA